MHEGEWSSRLGIPGQPAEAEELMVMRDIALARLTGASVHFQHLSTAGIDRDGPRRASERRARHRRGHDAPLHADPRRVCASFDPVFKVNPPVAHRGRRRGGQRGTRRRRRRRDRDRPRAARAGGQGAAVRSGAARDARARDRSGVGAHRARTLPIDAVLALLSWRPAAIAGLARHARRADRPRLPREPLRHRSDRRVDGRAGVAREPQPQHALRGTHAHGVGCDTRCCAAKRS